MAWGSALVLAVCAAYVGYRARKAEADFPPTGRFVTVDGVRLHYRVHGPDMAAHTVVLLHGNGTMAEDFDLSGLTALAAQRWRVIVFDRPGYGYSERPPDRPWWPQDQAELLLRALQQLEVSQPVVLGHSWGASVALAMGIARPDQVAALVLASGYHTPSLRLDVAWLGLPALPLVGTLMRRTVSPLLGRLLWPLALRRLFAPAEPSAEFRRRYPVWMSLRPSQLRASAAEAAMMIPMAWRLRRHHRDLRVPAIIVAGAQDRLLSTRWSSVRLHERLPTSRLRIVGGSGHMVHHSATSQVMSALHQAFALVNPRRPLARGEAGGASPNTMSPAMPDGDRAI